MQPYSNSNINIILDKYKKKRLENSVELFFIMLLTTSPIVVLTFFVPGMWFFAVLCYSVLFTPALHGHFAGMYYINKQVRAWLQFANQANLTLMMRNEIGLWPDLFVYGNIDERDIILKHYRHRTFRNNSWEIVTRLSTTIGEKVEQELILFHEHSKRQIIEWEHVCGVVLNIIHLGSDDKYNNYYLASDKKLQVSDTFQDIDFNKLINLRNWRFRWYGNSAIADRFDVEYNSDNLVDVMDMLLMICERLEHNLSNSIEKDVL